MQKTPRKDDYSTAHNFSVIFPLDAALRRRVMMLGFSISAFTTFHVVISLIGIATGLVVLRAMLGGRHLGGLTATFLGSTVLTSVTGFMFPFNQLLPSHIVGLISLGVLALALVALYGKGLSGGWRSVYVITATVALYLNVFVGVVQAFQKFGVLHALAPTQAEAPFVVAQLAVLALFAVLGYLAIKRYHPTPGATA
jgi:hypothetical protein